MKATKWCAGTWSSSWSGLQPRKTKLWLSWSLLGPSAPAPPPTATINDGLRPWAGSLLSGPPCCGSSGSPPVRFQFGSNIWNKDTLNQHSCKATLIFILFLLTSSLVHSSHLSIFALTRAAETYDWCRRGIASLLYTAYGQDLQEHLRETLNSFTDVLVRKVKMSISL